MDYRFLRLLSVCLPLLMAVVPVWGQDGSGDGSTKETGLSIDIREMPLPEVLTQLQQLSGCSFLYDSDIVEKLPKITLKMAIPASTIRLRSVQVRQGRKRPLRVRALLTAD